jgi:hypothetical protein
MSVLHRSVPITLALSDGLQEGKNATIGRLLLSETRSD